MATVSTIMAELKAKGKESTRKIYARHGMAPERVFGVSVADLKVIAKTIKGQQALAAELYETGNMDAMYLAGLVLDGAKVERKRLSAWAESAVGLQMIGEYTIAWLAVEHPQGRALAMEWIASKKEHIATSGWCTYSGLLATKPDAELDLKEIEGLLGAIVKQIDGAPNRVRYTMNNFVIAAGTYVKPLAKLAKDTAKKIGDVSVDVGETACKVPVASEYIAKAEAAGKSGVKKKTIRC